MFLVLAIELVNSAVEATVDRIGLERHPLSAIAKELGSAGRVRGLRAARPQLDPGARMAALVCGSLAYDTVMVYPGRFGDHILPDKIHVLNLSFVVPTLRRNFGGCAGNIAYNLRLLESPGHAMGTVGHDFGPYREWMTKNGMSLRHVKVLDDEYTAQAYITTDLDSNQLTAFHPGAMTHSYRQEVPADGSIKIGVCAPDGRDGMIAHATQFASLKIPFIFDPGQAMTLFAGEELLQFVEQATWVTVNDYEATLLEERTGLSTGELAARVAAYVVTRGAEGSTVFAWWPPRRDSRGPCGSGRRPDGLRRRLSRRPRVRPAARPRLGNDRAHCFADGRDQDRDRRHAASSIHAGRVQGPFQ
jgi:adenosine kinase